MATIATSLPMERSELRMGTWKWTAGAAVALLVVTLGFLGWQRWSQPALNTGYQAVLLANGSVYFGKLEGVGSKFPILREVYYVQSGVDAETKQQKNILLKRGSEWHSPDRMILNASQIVLIEPVGEHSRVASLIDELRSNGK
jgi:hypothetical protein